MADWTPYADVNAILEELLTAVRAILNDRFVGLYLAGSLASGDFDYDTSDIDFLAATAVPPTAQQFAELEQMHDRIGTMDNKWAIELEGAYIPLAALRRYDPENATHPYIDRGASNLRWEHLDTDWVIHYHVLNAAGIALAGPAVQTLVDPVSPAQLRQAVKDLMDVWWLPMIEDGSKLAHDGYRAYAIMTMCRMLVTAQTGSVVSKPVAARWVMETQDGRWRSLAAAALEWSGAEVQASLSEVQAFIQFTRRSLDSKETS